MQNTPRNSNLMSVPGLSDEARKAVNAAFDAMSTWRIEIVDNSEKNSEQVIEKWYRSGLRRAWVLPLRQRTASLDLKRGDIGQLGDGTRDARPIFDRKLLR